ncbi:MAG: cytochrome P450 [Chloroflexi bacterium]|nr:MAG: cytochrome P450 [Chloroflexota bacterium]
MKSFKHSTDHNVPPGPHTVFFSGHLRDLQRDQLRFYANLRKKYGDIVRFRVLGPVFLNMFFHPNDIDYVLRRNHQNFQKGAALEIFKSLLGEGLLTSEGSFWLRQRRLAQPAFHRQRVAALAPIMTGATATMLERWQAFEQNGQSVDVSVEMTNLTFQIVAKALFSINVEGEVDAVGRAFTVALEQINYRLNHLALPDQFPTRHNRRYLQARRVLDSLVYDIIQQRRRTTEDRGDLLSMFLLARDEETGEQMSDKQLRDEVMTMILAGHETTANTMTWIFYLLAQHPVVERKLQAELASVLGGRAPSLTDLANLPYTRMIIDEALRLYPPAPGISRKAVADDEIGGYTIPAGSEIAVSQYVTHRHPDFWDRPEAFDPERFLPERSAQRPHFAYFPFGGGPRLCIGNAFALMEAHLILATIAQRYQLRLVPGHPVVPEPLVTLRPRFGLMMTLQKLKG